MVMLCARIKAAMFAGMAAALLAAPAAADGRRFGPVGPPDYLPPVWSGFYVGAHLGYASVDAEAKASGFGTTVGVRVEDSDAVGGLQVGYNWRAGQYVFGVEADIDVISDLNLGSIRGRIGFAPDNLLVYATAGLAFADGETDSTTGFVIGGGVELDLNSHWRNMTVGVEALYYAFEEQNGTVSAFGNVIHYSVDADAFVVRGRLNYHFR